MSDTLVISDQLNHLSGTDLNRLRTASPLFFALLMFREQIAQGEMLPEIINDVSFTVRLVRNVFYVNAIHKGRLIYEVPFDNGDSVMSYYQRIVRSHIRFLTSYVPEDYTERGLTKTIIDPYNSLWAGESDATVTLTVEPLQGATFVTIDNVRNERQVTWNFHQETNNGMIFHLAAHSFETVGIQGYLTDVKGKVIKQAKTFTNYQSMDRALRLTCAVLFKANLEFDLSQPYQIVNLVPMTLDELLASWQKINIPQVDTYRHTDFIDNTAPRNTASRRTENTAGVREETLYFNSAPTPSVAVPPYPVAPDAVAAAALENFADQFRAALRAGRLNEPSRSQNGA